MILLMVVPKILVISTLNAPGRISKGSRKRTKRSASLINIKGAHEEAVTIQVAEMVALEVVEGVDETATEAIEDEGGPSHEVEAQAGAAEVEDEDEAEARPAKAPIRVLRLLAQP